MAQTGNSWAKARRRGLSVMVGAGVLVAWAAPALGGDGTFTLSTGSQPNPGNGVRPSSVAVADLDGDGNQDLLVTSFIDGHLSAWLGNGLGGFTPAAPPPLAAGSSPFAAAVIDADGDGAPDVVTALGIAGVAQFTGLGTGQPLAGPARPDGSFPSAIAVADMNGDGLDDIVTASSSTKKVSTFPGLGTGAFADAASAVSIPGSVKGLAIGDLDEDGTPDVVVGSAGSSIAVMLGTAAGRLGSPRSVAVGKPDANALAVGDVDGDGHLDVVVGNPGNGVSILLGDGSGGFAAPALEEIAGGAGDTVALGDVTGDSALDIVTLDRLGGTFATLRGDGRGGFSAARFAPMGFDTRAIAMGDFDNDGNVDLATAEFAGKVVSVRLGNGPSPNDDNLLVGPGAEGPGASGTRAGAPAVPGWTRTSGAPTFVRYSSPEFPTFIDAARWAGGTNLFAGGIGPSASMNQTISVAGRAALIDAGRLSARLSGSLGGHATEGDSARVSVKFFDASNAELGTAVRIGPVTAADRRKQTVLLRRRSSGAVPVGTRSIVVTLTFTRSAGTYNQATADNLALRLATVPAPVAPATGGGRVVLPGAPAPLCRGQRATLVATTGLTVGTPGADVIVGRPGRDVIRSLGGADLVCGRGGSDLISGGAGADVLAGEKGDDTLLGGPGADLLVGGPGRDLLRGGPGLDRLLGGPGVDRQVP